MGAHLLRIVIKTLKPVPDLRDGEIVRDERHRETFIYNARRDAARAHELRPATEKERKRFEAYTQPTRP